MEIGSKGNGQKLYRSKMKHMYGTEKHKIIPNYTSNSEERTIIHSNVMLKRNMIMKQLENINELYGQSETKKFHVVVHRMTKIKMGR